MNATIGKEASAGTVSGEGAFSLDFDTWAALSARLLKLDAIERMDVLDGLGISATDWNRVDEQHFAALGDDIAAGRMDRVERYGQVCAAELSRRKSAVLESPPVLEDATTPAGVGEAPTPSVVFVGAPAVAEAADVPSYLLNLMADVKKTAGPSPLSGTMDAPDLPTFIKRAAANPLPFGEAPSPVFAAVTSTTASAPAEASGMTMPIGVDLFAQIKRALPFPAGAASATKPGEDKRQHAPRLPLETYASLCAELAVFPERASEILRKYGIRDDAARRAVDGDWHARLSAHTETREEWLRLRTTYESWLRTQSR